jgi:DNA-binding beta-propeller fold protein YncE
VKDKRIKTMIAIVLIAIISPTASAMAYTRIDSYESYGYNAWGESVAMPDGYAPEGVYYGKDFGCSSLNEASDLSIADNGNIYIADSGNNRIIVLGPDLKLRREITDLVDPDGNPDSFRHPTGVFCDEQDRLYVADADNGRVLKLDLSGKILQVFTEPQDSDIQNLIEFKPSKVMVDESGVVYVLVDGLYRGAITYDSSGSFTGFFASNTVEVQGLLLIDRFKQLFMTRIQRRKQYRIIPYEISNMTLDKRGFVYTSSNARLSITSLNEIKKFNFAGMNIFTGSRSDTPAAWSSNNFGDIERASVNGVDVDTSLTDLVVDDQFFVTAVDATRGRIFQYDPSANLVFVFGGIGDQSGTFQIPSTIESDGEKLYVLDFSKNSLTIFRPTDLGRQVRQAVTLYQDGLYVESIDLWQKVLKTNTNFEMAYVGLGKAYYQLGEYRTAMNYFNQGNDLHGYSLAFSGYRSMFTIANFGWIALALALMSVALIWMILWRKRRRRSTQHD